MIDSQSKSATKSAPNRMTVGRALANAARRATGCDALMRSVCSAWPPMEAALARLAYYLTDRIPDASGNRPLLHACLARFEAQMGDWRGEGLSTLAIRHALAAMLVEVRSLADVRAHRGEYVWNPCLEVAFYEFEQGLGEVHFEPPVAGTGQWHPDDILRVIGNFVLPPEVLYGLGLDLRRLIREFEATWQA